MAKYIYQQGNWSNFTRDEKKISLSLAAVRYSQGRLLAKMTLMG